MSYPVYLWPTSVSDPQSKWHCTKCDETMDPGENCRGCGETQARPSDYCFLTDGILMESESVPTTISNWKCSACNKEVTSSNVCTNPNCGQPQPTQSWALTDGENIESGNCWPIFGQYRPNTLADWWCEACNKQVVKGKVCPTCERGGDDLTLYCLKSQLYAIGIQESSYV
ncbi:hypothetical protein F4801DRAFT_447384 [Xylaria longipes]|nr:hypothetical protein F4801DRAFT_447384 [Xylaria longipes]